MVEEKKGPISSNFFTMVFVLTIVAVLSALALGLTYVTTKDRIRLNSQLETQRAIRKVLPSNYDNDPTRDRYTVSDEEGEALSCFPARRDGKLVGTAIKTYSDEGFNERIELMVGFDPDQRIIDIYVCEQSETPGLGNKIGQASFIEQFRNISLQQVPGFELVVGREIDGITAATISSRAFCDAVNRAYRVLSRGRKR